MKIIWRLLFHSFLWSTQTLYVAGASCADAVRALLACSATLDERLLSVQRYEPRDAPLPPLARDAEGLLLNLIDSPGHVDFSAEVTVRVVAHGARMV